MSLENEKCVIIMDEGLPLGLIANTAAILGITLGKTLPEVVGAAVEDASSQSHLGIIEFPLSLFSEAPRRPSKCCANGCICWNFRN